MYRFLLVDVNVFMSGFPSVSAEYSRVVGGGNETFSFSLLSTIFGVQLFMLRLSFFFGCLASSKAIYGTIDYLLYCGRTRTLA